MSFQSPSALFLLLAVPALALVYGLLQRRRQKAARNFGTLGLLRPTGGSSGGVRRYVPPVLFLLAVTILTLALARPQSTVFTPRVTGTVILVFDESGSMSAQDIQPSRLEAAKAAALDFVRHQPGSVQIGVVAFSDGGLSLVPPTNKQEAVQAAIQRLSPQRGTSVGSGILAALNLIEGGDGSGNGNPGTQPTPAPAVGHNSAVIVLLTDGENNMSPDPAQVAQAAAAAGIRIDTIGVGSPEGVTLDINGFMVHTQLNEASLKQIAQVSGGRYYNAQSDTELRRIYEGIKPALTITKEEVEVTSLFSALGMMILLAGGALSLLWFGRVP